MQENITNLHQAGAAKGVRFLLRQHSRRQGPILAEMPAQTIQLCHGLQTVDFFLITALQPLGVIFHVFHSRFPLIM